MPRPPAFEHALFTMAADNLYTLSVKPTSEKTTIVMRLLIPQVNMQDFPQTSTILSLFLPSIFRSTCYNDEQLPFPEEVKCTEVGHLFEHILLEYLCLAKLDRGFDNAVYEGVTDWNWMRDPRGTFHITINTSREDFTVLSQALDKTTKLLNTILLQNVSCVLPSYQKTQVS